MHKNILFFIVLIYISLFTQSIRVNHKSKLKKHQHTLKAQLNQSLQIQNDPDHSTDDLSNQDSFDADSSDNENRDHSMFQSSGEENDELGVTQKRLDQQLFGKIDDAPGICNGTCLFYAEFQSVFPLDNYEEPHQQSASSEFGTKLIFVFENSISIFQPGDHGDFPDQTKHLISFDLNTYQLPCDNQICSVMEYKQLFNLLLDQNFKPDSTVMKDFNGQDLDTHCLVLIQDMLRLDLMQYVCSQNLKDVMRLQLILTEQIRDSDIMQYWSGMQMINDEFNEMNQIFLHINYDEIFADNVSQDDQFDHEQKEYFRWNFYTDFASPAFETLKQIDYDLDYKGQNQLDKDRCFRANLKNFDRSNKFFFTHKYFCITESAQASSPYSLKQSIVAVQQWVNKLNKIFRINQNKLVWAYFAHPNIRQKGDNDESNDEENNVKISLSEKLNQVQVNESDDNNEDESSSDENQNITEAQMRTLNDLQATLIISRELEEIIQRVAKIIDNFVMLGAYSRSKGDELKQDVVYSLTTKYSRNHPDLMEFLEEQIADEEIPLDVKETSRFIDYYNPYWNFYKERIDQETLSKATNTFELFYDGKVIQSIQEILNELHIPSLTIEQVYISDPTDLGIEDDVPRSLFALSFTAKPDPWLEYLGHIRDSQE